jgi:eukaryotic-like serine/threonine-protein kinase
MGRTGQHQGTVIGGRYRLVERLGTGGMAVVWQGFDETLGRSVAVKVLAPRLAADTAFRERLRQEALAAARLCHPHITGVYDFGESPLSERLTVPFVVMELNDGESVAARLQRQGALPAREAVSVAAEVASALATAHARGVVHRDVTPANVMLTGAGAKVVDFGISALVGQRDAAPDGSLLGTPAYLAPERLGGGPVTTATDVYALGLLLYRCLTGRFPWPAENTAAALRAHLYADPEPLPALPGLPAEVADLCLRCLAKNPDDRPAAREVATTLAAVVGAQPIIVRGAVRSVRASVPAIWRRRARWDHRIAPVLRRLLPPGPRRLQAGMLTVLLLLVGSLAWASAREPTEADSAQAAAAGAEPGPVIVSRACKVRYRVRHDWGDAFEARVTVRNAGPEAVTGWRLKFTYPGGQRLARTRGVVQHGRTVLLVARPGARLDAGRSFGMILRGSYRDANPLPLTFALDGHPCATEVIGATTERVREAADDRPVGAKRGAR